MSTAQVSEGSESTAPASQVPAAPAAPRLSRRLIAVIPTAVLVLLVLLVASQRPSFLGPISLRTLLEGAAPLLLLALGQTFVILTGGIDLSQAVLASFGTVLLALWLPIGGPAGALAVLVALTLAGTLNGLVCAYAQIPSFVVTLGTMGLWAGVALAVSGSSTISITKGYDTIFWLRDLRVAGLPVSALLAIGAVVLAAVLMKVLSRGRSLHAMGLAERAVQMSGTRTFRMRVLAFSLSGLCAGLAAMVLAASQFSGAPALADSLQLPSIAAVVVGGTLITGGIGGPLRTLVGALLVVVLRVGMSVAGVPPSYEQIVYGTVIVAAVALTLDRRRMDIVK
ncbi:MAG TPA: ABC transporter permease [Pseudonocardia sp.]|uniref:ABC transporter permease n=1 Tax=Pseudonocardia sp. TaxID=60912 RepID=UPI002BB01432|nr:ABC transporter permease [Pseudonocardia sp.]HTF53791.1 ABC transporter permease [Pseudonocardia sp.]